MTETGILHQTVKYVISLLICFSSVLALNVMVK